MSEDAIPTIKQKVLFWKEQDRINEALIPRVIELGKRQSEISEKIAALDARVLQPVQDLRNEIATLNSRMMQSAVAVCFALVVSGTALILSL